VLVLVLVPEIYAAHRGRGRGLDYLAGGVTDNQGEAHPITGVSFLIAKVRRMSQLELHYSSSRELEKAAAAHGNSPACLKATAIRTESLNCLDRNPMPAALNLRHIKHHWGKRPRPRRVDPASHFRSGTEKDVSLHHDVARELRRENLADRIVRRNRFSRSNNEDRPSRDRGRGGQLDGNPGKGGQEGDGGFVHVRFCSVSG
jgi:hypothetical protein